MEAFSNKKAGTQLSQPDKFIPSETYRLPLLFCKLIFCDLPRIRIIKRRFLKKLNTLGVLGIITFFDIPTTIFLRKPGNDTIDRYPLSYEEKLTKILCIRREIFEKLKAA
ncbi:MAG: hypothetical protein WC335_05325, partial [Candidatus Omnitrophota bacterium]